MHSQWDSGNEYVACVNGANCTTAGRLSPHNPKPLQTIFESDKINSWIWPETKSWKVHLWCRACQISWSYFCEKNGLSADEEIVSAILHLNVPSSKTQVRRSLGMVVYLSQFVSNLSEGTGPLRKLTLKDVEFVWEGSHQKCFKKIKEILNSTPVLAYYDIIAELTLQVDEGGGCSIDPKWLTNCIGFQNGAPNFTDYGRCGVRFGAVMVLHRSALAKTSVWCNRCVNWCHFKPFSQLISTKQLKNTFLASCRNGNTSAPN